MRSEITTSRCHEVLTLIIAAAVAVSCQTRIAEAQTGPSRTVAGGASAPEANLFVGGATTSVPIELPPGRGRATPHLALVYSSSGGPSLYGYGWDLDIPKIQRRTKHGVLNCAYPEDFEQFVLTLAGQTIEFEREGDNPILYHGRALKAVVAQARYVGEALEGAVIRDLPANLLLLPLDIKRASELDPSVTRGAVAAIGTVRLLPLPGEGQM